MKNTKLAVTLTTTAIMAANAAAQNSTMDRGGPAPTETTFPAVQAADISGKSRDELKAQLGRVPRIEAAGPEDVEMAMCYSMSPFVVQQDYVCPVCGERTVREDDDAARLDLELLECRRLYALLPASAGLKLDENEFCRKCSPRVEKPTLGLLVLQANGKTRRIRDVTTTDLRMLNGYYQAATDQREGMKRTSRRLRKLLGL